MLGLLSFRPILRSLMEPFPGYFRMLTEGKIRFGLVSNGSYSIQKPNIHFTYKTFMVDMLVTSTTTGEKFYVPGVWQEKMQSLEWHMFNHDCNAGIKTRLSKCCFGIAAHSSCSISSTEESL
ncbi:hypothetical protein CDAR_463501 [Caerostris darwini]|uniref:Uncharacterized protein n=1 Tax=Caerostris darwini TaxID=1538125 RepID=A0AAV4RPJ8_9ARAC|nr:hypothetical protein CDAR_463501 [Caerostris darwini]